MEKAGRLGQLGKVAFEKRIDVILAVLRQVWMQKPEQRLGQLLINIDTKSNVPDLFFLTDEEFLKILEKEYEEVLTERKRLELKSESS